MTRSSKRCALLLSTALLGLMLSGCDKPEEKEAKYLARGNALFEKGEFEKARVEYRNAARIRPTDPEVRYRIALINEAQGDLLNAFGGFVGAEQQDAHYKPAQIKLAQYFLAGNQLEESKRRLDAVLADSPDDPEALALRAALLLREKDYEGTEKNARAALEKDPANVTAHSVLTGLYANKGDDEKALQIVRDGITRNPQELSLLLLQAMLYAQKNDYDKIRDTYHEVFKLKPTETRFRSDLAEVLVKANRVDEAEAELRDGLKALPDSWEMKHAFVGFLAKNRNLDIAEKEIHAFMEAEPNKPELAFWLADLYISHNASERAVALLEQLAARQETDPTGLNARTSLARIHFAKGEKETAEKLVALVLNKDANNRDALLIRAQLAYDAGDYEKAVGDLRTLLRDNPKTKNALHLLAETLLTQGHVDLAIDTLKQLVDADPAALPARVRLAQITGLNGDSQRAQAILTTVTKTEPTYAVAWESVARVAIAAKDWVTADKALKTLETLPNQKPTALFLRGQIQAATNHKDEATALFKQVIEADPSAPVAEHALSALVDVYASSKRTEEAAAFLSSLKTRTPFIETLLGDVLLIQNKFEESAASFDKAIAEKPTFQDPYLGLARILIKNKQADQALDLLHKAEALAPADSRATMMEADYLGTLARYREAAPLYEKILVREPKHIMAANNLAQLIADNEPNDKAALERARQIAERFVSSSNPYLLDTLAWVYYRQGNLIQAQSLMDLVLAAPGALPPQIHYHHGVLLLKAGKTAEAKEALKKAVESSEPYSGLDEAKKLLEQL